MEQEHSKQIASAVIALTLCIHGLIMIGLLINPVYHPEHLKEDEAEVVMITEEQLPPEEEQYQLTSMQPQNMGSAASVDDVQQQEVEQAEQAETKEEERPQEETKPESILEEDTEYPDMPSLAVTDIKPHVNTPEKVPKPNLPTFAQLAQQFIDKAHQAAPVSVTVDAGQSRAVNAEDIKYMRYLEKVVQCIQTIIFIRRKNNQLGNPLNSKVSVVLTLQRDGRLSYLAIGTSSGNKSIDQFFLDATKESSSTFPPMPAFFKTDHYTFEYIVSFR